MIIIQVYQLLRVIGEKKIEKSKKLEKNNRKNRAVKKNRLKFWKNQPVRFYKPKTEKTKPNPNRKKTEPNRKNRVKLVWTDSCPKKPNWTGKKIRFGYFFL
jgi:hypothetical protein